MIIYGCKEHDEARILYMVNLEPENLYLKHLIDKNDTWRNNSQEIFSRIQPKDRSAIIQRIFTICKKIECSEDTPFLAVTLFDYILARYMVLPTDYDIYMVACISIASKLHDDAGPGFLEIGDYVRMRMDTAQQAEREVLRIINWNVNMITPASFIIEMDLSSSIRTAALYIIAIIMQTEYALTYTPLHITLIALFITYRVTETDKPYHEKALLLNWACKIHVPKREIDTIFSGMREHIGSPCPLLLLFFQDVKIIP